MLSIAQEIEDVIRRLTQGNSDVQSTTIDQYFDENAIFVHPLCRTWSEPCSRWTVKKIYQWYKTMSPEIQLDVHSIGMVSLLHTCSFHMKNRG